VVAADHTVTLASGTISPIPDQRHSLHADEDSVVLLSVTVEM
jgi:hypothetical protein